MIDDDAIPQKLKSTKLSLKELLENSESKDKKIVNETELDLEA